METLLLLASTSSPWLKIKSLLELHKLTSYTFKGFTVRQFIFKMLIEIKVLYYNTPQPLHEFFSLVTVPL